MAWPDDPIPTPDWLPGYVDDATMNAKITARLNALVARVGIIGPSTTAAVPTTPTGALSGTGLATINTQRWIRVGDVIALQMLLTMGATVTVPGDGNVANTQVAQVNDVNYQPYAFGMFLSGDTGPLAHFALNALGALTLVSAAPGSTIVSGTQFRLGGVVVDA